MCLVAYSLNKSKAEFDFFFVLKSTCIYVNDAVLMLIRGNFYIGKAVRFLSKQPHFDSLEESNRKELQFLFVFSWF